MKSLPKIHWIEDPNRGKLEKWFAVRRADLLLREAEAPSELPAQVDSKTDFVAPTTVPIAPYDYDVNVGDIRLLSPHLSPLSDRPLYVAIFREWEEELVLVASFSPYSLAATRTELEFPERSHALRVLSVWNSLTVHPIALSESWKVDSLSEEERRDIWQVFRHASAGHPLPQSLIPRVGCPIRRPADPRVTYQEEESSTLGYLAEISAPLDLPDIVEPVDESARKSADVIDLSAFDDVVLPLAAYSVGANASIGKDGNIANFSIPGIRSKLRLMSTGKEVVLVVHEPDGSAGQQLNFSAIVGADGTRLATIHNGLARWPVSKAQEKVKIVLPSGQTLKLVRE